MLAIATGNKPGVATSAPLPVPPIVTVNCRVEFVLLTEGNFVSVPPNNAVTVGFSVVPKKPPFTLKATGAPVPCGMLSGDVPTAAGRTGTSDNVQLPGLTHVIGVLTVCCSTENVRLACVAGGLGEVAMNESGSRTCISVPAADTGDGVRPGLGTRTSVVGTCRVPLTGSVTNTLVVERKFVPVKYTS